MRLLCVVFQDSSQIELLKELMDLQKDMVVMLLSLLEGESLVLPDREKCLLAFSSIGNLTPH